MRVNEKTDPRSFSDVRSYLESLAENKKDERTDISPLKQASFMIGCHGLFIPVEPGTYNIT